MKNKFFFVLFLFATVAATAQITSTTPDSSVAMTTTTTASPIVITTASTIIDVASLKGITTETLRPELVFPALGIYKATGTSTTDVIVSLDEVNKGIVWVNGLPQGKFKALMKKSPSTYKIPAQKTDKGSSIAEGTLFLNPESKELTIVLGRSFNDTDPTSFLSVSSDAKPKTKKMKKTWRYTGIKTDASATVLPQSSNQ